MSALNDDDPCGGNYFMTPGFGEETLDLFWWAWKGKERKGKERKRGKSRDGLGWLLGGWMTFSLLFKIPTIILYFSWPLRFNSEASWYTIF